MSNFESTAPHFISSATLSSKWIHLDCGTACTNSLLYFENIDGMSSLGHASSLHSVSRPRRSLALAASEFLPTPWQPALTVEKVLGPTTSDQNGFSSNGKSRQFAFCAGAVAVLCWSNDDDIVLQKVFRADNVSTDHVYMGKGHPGPSIRTLDSPKSRRSTHRMSGINTNASSPISSNSADFRKPRSPPKSNTISRNRLVTCVALSPDGRFLAIGEVSV